MNMNLISYRRSLILLDELLILRCEDLPNYVVLNRQMIVSTNVDRFHGHDEKGQEHLHLEVTFDVKMWTSWGQH